jgi:hypothetical protein
VFHSVKSDKILQVPNEKNEYEQGGGIDYHNPNAKSLSFHNNMFKWSAQPCFGGRAGNYNIIEESAIRIGQEIFI